MYSSSALKRMTRHLLGILIVVVLDFKISKICPAFAQLTTYGKGHLHFTQTVMFNWTPYILYLYSRTCESNRQWSGREPECLEINCGLPGGGVIPNGWLEGSR